MRKERRTVVVTVTKLTLTIRQGNKLHDRCWEKKDRVVVEDNGPRFSHGGC
jgi:archaeosine-15-forming tRNA-guanine transglycosylase